MFYIPRVNALQSSFIHSAIRQNVELKAFTATVSGWLMIALFSRHFVSWKATDAGLGVKDLSTYHNVLPTFTHFSM